MNCKDCSFWRGNDSSYSALCDNFNQKTAFNDSCREFKARQLTVKAGEQLDEKIKEYRDYNGMRMFSNGLTEEDWIK